MFLSSLQLTDEQIAQKELEFQQILLNPKTAHTVYLELKDFFAKPATSEEIKKYWYSYWRWYTYLTWERLNALSNDDFISIALPQIPMALLLDYDVSRSLFVYFAANNFFDGELESFYVKLKESFYESQAVIGQKQGKDVTVAEIIKEVDRIYGKGDSLVQADFESSLEQMMFPGDEMSKKYFIADPEQVKERFLNLVTFFETFTPENIWTAVNTFINSQNSQNIVPGEAPLEIAAPAPAQTPPQPTSQSTPNQEPKLVVPPTIRPAPSPAQIKSQIESEFKKDAEGNFADIEGVMAKLSELAEKNNDPKIAEMIYYDETENKFKWSI